jgi:hypothetical protein
MCIWYFSIKIGFNLCTLQCNIILHVYPIKSWYVGISYDILGINLLKWYYDVIWLDVCIKIFYTVSA